MKFREFLLLIWTITLILFRPSIFGEKYNPVVFVFFLLISALILLSQPYKSVTLNKGRVVIVLLMFICIGYFFLQGLILSDAKHTVVNSCVLLFFTIPFIALVVNNHQEKILKIFVNFHYVLAISAIVTFAIFLGVGLTAERLPIIASLAPVTQYEATGSGPFSNHVLVFPYSVYWSINGIFGIDFPRFVGLYREPGMSQIFFITAFALTMLTDIKNPKRKRIIIFAASVLTFSAAGMLNLALVMLFFTFFNSSLKQAIIKIIRNPIFILIGLVFLVFLSKAAVTMIQERFQDISGTTRLESFVDGFDRLKKNPAFGEGYYNSFKTDAIGRVTSENFIGIVGVSYQIGFVGLLLYSLCWTYALLNITDRRAFIVFIPCLLTLIFSQPSYNDIFTWFLLMLNTRDFTALHS